MALADQTTLERVRLRQSRAGPTVSRQRLSHLLASASLNPPAMPPSAILLVRAMADPLPGRITHGLGAGSLASAEWQRAARDRLGALYGSAARPLRGAAPSSAAAVLFADYAELLACLARDLVFGTALGWWWQSILRRIPSRLPGSWVAVWAEQPLYIPAALEHLAARQQAVKVLERISPVQAWNLLMIMLRAFDLPGLMVTRGPIGSRATESAAPDTASAEQRARDALARPAARKSFEDISHAASIARIAEKLRGASTPTAENAATSPAKETGEGSFQSPPIARPPWEPYVPRAYTPPELGYERQALLGLGLLLSRVRQVAFSPTFALRFRAWVRAEESGGRISVEDSSASHMFPAELRTRDPVAWESAPARRSPPPIPTEGALSAPTDFSQPASQPAKYPLRSSPDETFHRIADQLRPSQADAADVPAETVPIAREREWEAGEFTRAGGILFLIHFLLRADLLRSFHTGLGGWALLELLARCLVDDAWKLGDDAIWAALACLDGRDAGTPPGSSFEPQPTYAAPESWLESAAGKPQFARFRSRGMEIWSAEGFLVLDSENIGRPSDEPKHMTSSHRRKLRRLAAVRPISLSVSPELRRFLHFVLPYARWRLGRALGGAPLETVLLRAGRLYVTATHVDLVMPMREISLPARMGGLDANPGWVPELGRVVTFHFMQEG